MRLVRCARNPLLQRLRSVDLLEIRVRSEERGEDAGRHRGAEMSRVGGYYQGANPLALPGTNFVKVLQAGGDKVCNADVDTTVASVTLTTQDQGKYYILYIMAWTIALGGTPPTTIDITARAAASIGTVNDIHNPEPGLLTANALFMYPAIMLCDLSNVAIGGTYPGPVTVSLICHPHGQPCTIKSTTGSTGPTGSECLAIAMRKDD